MRFASEGYRSDERWGVGGGSKRVSMTLMHAEN